MQHRKHDSSGGVGVPARARAGWQGQSRTWAYRTRWASSPRFPSQLQTARWTCCDNAPVHRARHHQPAETPNATRLARVQPHHRTYQQKSCKLPRKPRENGRSQSRKPLRYHSFLGPFPTSHEVPFVAASQAAQATGKHSGRFGGTQRSHDTEARGAEARTVEAEQGEHQRHDELQKHG